ncbi:MAG: PEGA domain-containing protein [Polyangiales bacterium]
MRTRLSSSIRPVSLVALVALTTPMGVLTLTTQTARAEMDADTKEAKVLFEDGVKLYRDGHFEEARVKFKAAYGLKKRPSILLNLARAELQTKRPLDAAAHFRELLAMSDAKPEDREDARAGLTDAHKQLGVVTIEAPDGSALTIDGEARGTTPVDPIDVIPGSHSVTIKAPGGRVTTEKVTLMMGQTTTVRARTEAKAEPATVDKKSEEEPKKDEPTTSDKKGDDTSTESGATYDDGDAKKEEAPHKVDDASEGSHRSFLKSLSPLTYVAAGVTVSSTVLWIVFYQTYATHKSNVDSITSWLQQNPNDAQFGYWQAQGRTEVDAANSNLHLSWAFEGLAIVGGVTTIATLIWMRDTGPSEKPHASGATAPTAQLPSVMVTAAPLMGGGGFVSLSGRF